MGHSILSNVQILLAQYDLSSDMFSVKISRSRADLDGTVFGTTSTKARIMGLMDVAIGMSGLMNLASGGQDEIASGAFSLADIPLLISLSGGADGDRCKFGPVMQGSYESGGPSGDRAEWTASALLSAEAFIDGYILKTGPVSGTFNGTARQLGAVASGQKLYAQIHALAKTAFTSAVFKVQSSSTQGGSYTTRATFSTLSDVGSQYITPVSGPFTDTWWRVICDAFTGTSLDVHVAVGIL